MISKLGIKGFKSIREANLDCRRINLFIGAPNTGKSNILEALGVLSWLGNGGNLQHYVRMDFPPNLFYDGLVDQNKCELIMDQQITIMRYHESKYKFIKGAGQLILNLNQDGSHPDTGPWIPENHFLKFYRFIPLNSFDSNELECLLPPHGRNLVRLVYSSAQLRKMAVSFFSPYNLNFVVKPHEKKLEIQKYSEGLAISIPYHLTSDTLQRMVFYTAAIESNKASTLVFEEPEAHAFPYFTKHLGERIALDENKNQYFIATHNPYLLTAVVEKAPADDVAVFAVSYKDYATQVRLLKPEELARLFEADPFLQLESVIEEGA